MAVHCFKACVAIICFVAVTCHLLPVAIICVLQFVLLGVLPRAILRAPVRAFWCTPSCHFACFSSCFLVGCLVPFCVLQFVLFGVLLRANLCAPVRASWCTPSWVSQWSSQNGARTNSPLHMQVLWLNCLALAGCEQLGRATPETAKNGALQGGLWLNLAVSLVLLFVLCLVLTVTANRLEQNYILLLL